MKERRTAAKSAKSNADSGSLLTEHANPKSADLDLKTSLEIARIINAEDALAPAAVKKALPEIARGIDVITAALRRGGRLIYVGAGTSGRIAALDAAECPPTFHTDPRTVQFVMAGGPAALGAAVEANEDSPQLGRAAMAAKKPGKNDVVVGLAASGRTPFTVAAIEYARNHGAQTIAVTSSPGSPLARAAQLAIVTNAGPEVIAGSTRLKAGTTQKLVLNMLSTGAMTRLGYVYGNLMVNVQVKNAKLTRRAIGILRQLTGVNAAAAESTLAEAGSRVPVALVMLKSGVSRKQAEKALRRVRGHVRQAIAAASRTPPDAL